MAVEVEDDGSFAWIKIAGLQLGACTKITNKHWILVLGQVVSYLVYSQTLPLFIATFNKAASSGRNH